MYLLLWMISCSIQKAKVLILKVTSILLLSILSLSKLTKDITLVEFFSIISLHNLTTASPGVTGSGLLHMFPANNTHPEIFKRDSPLRVMPPGMIGWRCICIYNIFFLTDSLFYTNDRQNC